MRKFCWSVTFALVFCSSLYAGVQTVRVSDPAAVRGLVSAGGTVVAEYESFSIIEIEQSPSKTLADSPAVEVLQDAGKIMLNAGVVDTSAAETQTKRARTDVGKGRSLHLVQFAGPIQKKWMDQLTAAGFRVVDYIPENAYLVFGDSAALTALRAADPQRSGVRWEGSYLPSDRIHPDVNTALAKYSAGDESANLFAIQMYRDKTANADTMMLIDALKTAPVYRENRLSRYYNVVVKLQPDAIETLAGQPDVISIRPYVIPKKLDERQDMIVAGQLSGNGPSGPGYLAWLASKGFTQQQFTDSGFAVDVCDSGIDIGTTTPNHFGLYVGGNTAQASRVVYARLEGTPNVDSTIQGCDGHGTLNAHIIGGFNDLSGSPHADSAGYRYGLGVAPFVKLGSSTIFDYSNFTTPDYEDMISRAYRDGARISSDSWGADTYGGYDIDAQQYDALVRDAQQAGSAVASNGNQEITIVFAAGNAGPGTSTVGSPGTAKNVITVGAAENVHSHSKTNGGASTIGNDGCETPDTEANSANDIVGFSSRGPCSDGRKKPEIVAPGTHITGGVAQQLRTMAGIGNDLACFDASGVCGLLDDSSNYINFFPTNQQWYSTSSGTSHSTPALAGGCALVRQYFINKGWTVPSPAMVKAYLMNAARYMNGVDANDALWSNSQGMGMMNLDFAFDGVPRVRRDQESADKFTASGQTRTMAGLVVSNSKPFRVTLSWTDAPGSTSGNSYNNDLNLVVVAGGVTYKGNVFSGSNSVAGGTADAKNNTESIFLPAGTTGAVVITVSAANINSDGVPNDGDALDQDYALVAYNFVEVAMPVIAGAGSVLAQESCGVTTNGAIDPDETVTVRFALQNVGSADTTNVVATLQAAGGVTAPSGAQAYGALLAGGAAVTNSFTFTATGECGGVISAVLTLQDGAASLGSVAFDFIMGDSILMMATNQNTSSITLTDNSKASPYPSTISVAGLAGTVSKVVVTLNGFSHTWPEDVDIILVSPDGEKVCLMGAVGGGTAVSGLTLTFDDDAAGAVPTPIISGTYQPGGSPWAMPTPGPEEPYAVMLSEFNGGNPNGVWSLYAADQAEGDSGSISGGWKITVTASEPLCCGSNKPPVISPVGNKSIIESNLLEFTVIATDNYDGDPITLVASNVPAGASFLAGTFSWASPAPTGTYSVTFNASDKDGYDEETISITVSPTPYVDTNCAVLFSEYVEGSSNNKAVEIFNPGIDPLDLGAGNYIVEVYANGASSPNSTINLTGTIPSQDVFILVNSGAGATLLGMADQTSGSLGFNGDDAVVLRSGGASGPILDVIGVVGTDPGTEWGSGTESTADNTLRRRPFVTRGDTNAVDAFIPSTEWTGYAVDTFDGLGTHTSDCTGPAVPTPPVLNAIGNKSVALNGTLQFQVTATPTESDTVTLTASNLPGGAAFYPTNEVGTLVWANASPTGTYSVTFNAADDDGFDEETITITVSETGGGGDCDVIISEYIEGTSNNKALEIFNGTADAIDLAAGTYIVQIYANGNISPNSPAISLTGTVAAAGTFVIANNAASNNVLAVADQVSSSLNFNGNDAVVLRSGGASGTILDSIGQVGTDPGAVGWGSDPVNTTDNTIRRKSSVTTGDSNTADAFDPSVEWDGYVVNTADGLGSHTMDCGGAVIPPDLGAGTAFDAASGSMILFWDNSGGGMYRVMFATNLLSDPAFNRTIASNLNVGAYTSPVEAEAVGAYRIEKE
ncbi:MAG: S8 family serine peptidase [Kiritimatiellia bacterium]